MMDMRKPDVIGIGFRRCASSWLHRCLNEHPSVGKTSGGIHYFSDHLDKGDDWYLQQFSAYADRKVVLDFSISYAYPENVQKFVEHMPRLLPKAKVFAIVRNPVERVFSDYRRSVFMEEFSPDTTFERALEESPILLERGRYRCILQTVLSAIPKDEIKIFFYDDIESCPERFWDEFCRFLDISSEFIPSCLYTPSGHLAAPRNPELHSFLRKVNRGVTSIVQSVGLDQFWRSLKGTSAFRKLVTTSIVEEGGIQLATWRELVTYYAEDITFLTRLTGRDLSGWLK
jgi:hypothetical protein